VPEPFDPVAETSFRGPRAERERDPPATGRPDRAVELGPELLSISKHRVALESDLSPDLLSGEGGGQEGKQQQRDSRHAVATWISLVTLRSGASEDITEQYL
jgi:hypothetical protein